jgi:hypothetical protein
MAQLNELTSNREELLRAARRVLVRHCLRRAAGRCAFCGGVWRHLAGLHPMSGCAARLYVGQRLAAAGWLSRPTRVPAVAICTSPEGA